MKHDPKTVDALLKNTRPPEFANPEHQALLRQSLMDKEALTRVAGPPKENRLMTMLNTFRSSRLRWAAATLVTVIVCALIFWPGGHGSTAALAAALAKLRQAQVMICSVAIESGSGQATRFKMAFKVPGLMRNEVSGQATYIIDATRKKSIMLLPKEKKYIEMPGLGHDLLPANMIQEMRELPANEDCQKLGRKVIDGRKVDGFRITQGPLVTTAWVDPATREIVRLEHESRDSAGRRVVMSEFQFDPVVASDYFSMTPPKDFQRLGVTADTAHASEKDLIELLRFAATYSGHFPDSLDPIGLGTELRGIASNPKAGLSKVPINERLKIGSFLQRGIIFVAKLDPRTDWQWAGKGVSPKDGSAPIFWYKPVGSERYRVITADLNVKELPASEIPALADFQNQNVRISESRWWLSPTWYSDRGTMDLFAYKADALLKSVFAQTGTRLKIEAALPDKRYDLKGRMPKGREGEMNTAAQQALVKYFALKADKETSATHVYILTAPKGKPDFLRAPKKTQGSSVDQTGTVFGNMGLGGITNVLSQKLGRPVFDETGIQGQFDYEFSLAEKDPEGVIRETREKYGLELTSARRDLEYTVLRNLQGPGQ